MVSQPPKNIQLLAAIRSVLAVEARHHGGIMVRAYWAVMLYHSPARITCPFCMTVSPFHNDIYHSVAWVQDHYGECPGPDQAIPPP